MADEGNGDVRWFPTVKTEWSLDVVGLLAVIGESSIEEHSQAITASLFGLLPRLIPAPQVFLKATRQSRMPATQADVTGVHSGITLDSMGYFANIITPLDEEPVFGFKMLDIAHAVKVTGVATGLAEEEEKKKKKGRGFMGLFGGGRGKKGKSLGDDGENGNGDEHPRPRRASIGIDVDEEAGVLSPASYSSSRLSPSAAAAANGSSPDPQRPGPRRRMQSRAQDFLTSPSDASKGERPAVPPSLYSPIHILSALSFINSIVIVVMAVIWKDGNAILSIAIISLVSTIVGAASFWRPILMKRRQNLNVPPGDVVIRTREGAFVLIRCTEDVARELYSGTEECEYYVNEKIYRFLMGVGTVLLMISIVLLGNCTWNSQVFIGASYIILNGLYWCLGMLPRSYFWDLSRYKWEVTTPSDARGAHVASLPSHASWVEDSERLPNFTRTLWYAIRETKRTDWVRTSGAAPATDAWREWLKEAEKNAREGNRSWNAVGRKNVLMNVDKTREEQKQQAAEDAVAAS